MNRQSVAETITLMGPMGEQILINMAQVVSPTDFKLKCSIVRALALTNILSPSIDFVIEILLKAAK